jgi:DNA-directed RNA polymerase specialized sigma24 family protein
VDDVAACGDAALDISATPRCDDGVAGETRPAHDHKGDTAIESFTAQHSGSLRPRPGRSSRDAYLHVYWAVIRDMARARRVSEDVVGFGTIRLLTRLDEIMARYPDPARYARANFANLALDWARREAAQRGGGAQFGRSVTSLEGAEDGSVERSLELARLLADQSVDDVVASLVDARRLLAEVRDCIHPRDWQVVWEIAVEGAMVSEVAARRGVHPSGIGRRYRAACAAIRAAAGELGLVGTGPSGA